MNTADSEVGAGAAARTLRATGRSNTEKVKKEAPNRKAGITGPRMRTPDYDHSTATSRHTKITARENESKGERLKDDGVGRLPTVSRPKAEDRRKPAKERIAAGPMAATR